MSTTSSSDRDARTLAALAVGRRLTLAGYFASPVTVEHADPEGSDTIFLRIRTQAGGLDEVPVPAGVLEQALTTSTTAAGTYIDGEDLFMLVESSRIRLAYAHDPYFAVSLSGIEALPHQLEAVYEQMVPQSQLRFLLAHDPGAGKTIMAGLLIKELKLRGVLDRVLVLCPSPLTLQWQDEMRSKFEETFRIVNAEVARNQLAGNIWSQYDQVIASIDFAKQEHVLPGILRSEWDLIVVDEAHKMSAHSYGTEVKKTKRYELGEQLSRISDRLLLCTATPHQGDVDQFGHFLRLLDEDQFASLDLDRDLIALEDSPWFSRRIKEDIKDFDGRPLFTPRIAVTVPFQLSVPEKQLYDEVTEYINDFLPRQSGRRRSSVALARTVFQRRLASSLGAIRATLDSRRRRFEEVLDELNKLSAKERALRLRELRLVEVDPELEGDDTDVELQDEIVSQATVAERIEDLQAEVERLGELVEQADEISKEDETKIEALRRCLDRAEFADLRDGRGKLLIFTEYRATMEHLVQHLESWGYSTCTIHGGMDALSRKGATYRFQTEDQICVATEAAGEGINLQFCHLMINYDIPWNPNRLEQRMGRIHRIGQQYPVSVFNFVADNTVEGTILRRLLDKLDEIRRALGSDRVFDVVGTLLQLSDVNIEEMLREAAYNQSLLPDYEAQIERISMETLERYEQATGIALATRQVNLDKVRPKDWRSEERRLMPEYVQEFFLAAAERARLRIEARADGMWRVQHVPQRLRSNTLPGVRRYGYPENQYRKLTFDKTQLLRDGRHLDAELMSPGHPLFAATTDILNEQLAHIRNGCAAFVDPAAAEEYRLYFFELQVLGEQGPEQPGGPPRTIVVHAELAVVCESADGAFDLAAPDILHDLTPFDGRADTDPIGPDGHRLAERWLRVHPAQTVMSEQRARRTHELSIRRDYMERSFDELERRRMARYSEFAAKVASGDDSYRLARDEAWRAREELQRRREQKLGELAHLEVLRPGPAAFLGSAVVLPLDDGRIASLARGERSSEESAIEMAMAYERNSGWEPDYVGGLRDGSGFDIRSTRGRPDGSVDVRRIEVKGHLGSDPTSILTPNEWTQARRHGETYWLYVISNCASNAPTLHRIRNPYAQLHRQAETLTIIKGHLIPGDAVARTAEEAS
jgi:superfamily II DNA or RNA helicase